MIYIYLILLPALVVMTIRVSVRFFSQLSTLVPISPKTHTRKVSNVSKDVQELLSKRAEDWGEELIREHEKVFPPVRFDERATSKVIQNKIRKDYKINTNSRIKTKRKIKSGPINVMDFTITASTMPDFLCQVVSGLRGLGVSEKEAKSITMTTYSQNDHKNATDLLNDCLKTL